MDGEREIGVRRKRWRKQSRSSTEEQREKRLTGRRTWMLGYRM